MKKKKIIKNYVKKRIAEIKASQRKKRPRRKKREKTVDIEIKAKGFYLRMDFAPTSDLDVVILNEANKLIARRAS